jgi:hypothetical protein
VRNGQPDLAARDIHGMQQSRRSRPQASPQVNSRDQLDTRRSVKPPAGFKIGSDQPSALGLLARQAAGMETILSTVTWGLGAREIMAHHAGHWQPWV